MKLSGLRHGREGHPLATNVAEDLKNHETEEEKVETRTDPCHNYESHLRKLVKEVSSSHRSSRSRTTNSENR